MNDFMAKVNKFRPFKAQAGDVVRITYPSGTVNHIEVSAFYSDPATICGTRRENGEHVYLKLDGRYISEAEVVQPEVV